MRNVRLNLCYDGTRYRGWQKLGKEGNTIQGKLELTLSQILGEEIQLHGSGRTDAGVHAKLQVANFWCESAMPCQEILTELRRYLPEDIGIYSCQEASERFHARLNVKSKTYCYRLWNDESPCVFERRFVSAFPYALDVDKMRQAASLLVGEHDFSAFCANRHYKKSTVRRVDAITVSREQSLLTIAVTGNGFLHHMVRILVGTLLEVGMGKREPASVTSLFGGKREDAGFLAEAKGLCLTEVAY